MVIVMHILYKFHEIAFSGYLVMAPDRGTEGRTDRRTEEVRKDGHGQTYISPPSAGAKNLKKNYEGESISNQPNLFSVEKYIHLFFYDVIDSSVMHLDQRC